jgi:Tfp pilus assembly protein PilO
MKWFKLSPKQQIVAMGAVFAVMLLLVVVFLVVPQILRVSALGVEEQTALQELNSAKSTYSQLEELKRSSRKTDNELLRLDRKAPDSGAELPALLVQIEDISAKSGITWMEILVSDPIQQTDYQEVTLEIKIDAYFFSLLDFIYRVEKLPRVIDIYNIEIIEGKAGLPNVEVTIRGNAYIMTPGLSGGSTTTPVAPTTAPAAAPTGGAAE